MKKLALALSLSPALIVSACDEPATESADKAMAEGPKKEVTVASMDPSASIDVGLAIGSEIPADVLIKTNDKEQTLGSALGNKPAVLIFTRSVEWCPFCQTQLKSVNGIVGKLKDRGYRVFGVSYDKPDQQDRFVKNQSLDYQMLSDETSTAIDAFGLRDPQYTEGRAMGVPYASVIVVDKDGKIVGKSVSGDFKKRPTNEQILALVDGI